CSGGYWQCGRLPLVVGLLHRIGPLCRVVDARSWRHKRLRLTANAPTKATRLSSALLICVSRFRCSSRDLVDHGFYEDPRVSRESRSEARNRDVCSVERGIGGGVINLYRVGTAGAIGSTTPGRFDNLRSGEPP